MRVIYEGGPGRGGHNLNRRPSVAGQPRLHMSDVHESSRLQEPASEILELVVRAGYRTVLIVPLLGAERIVGAFVVRRKRPGEFSKQTIDLCRPSLRDWAVIESRHVFERRRVDAGKVTLPWIERGRRPGDV